ARVPSPRGGGSPAPGVGSGAGRRAGGPCHGHGSKYQQPGGHLVEVTREPGFPLDAEQPGQQGGAAGAPSPQLLCECCRVDDHLTPPGCSGALPPATPNLSRAACGRQGGKSCGFWGKTPYPRIASTALSTANTRSTAPATLRTISSGTTRTRLRPASTATRAARLAVRTWLMSPHSAAKMRAKALAATRRFDGGARSASSSPSSSSDASERKSRMAAPIPSTTATTACTRRRGRSANRPPADAAMATCTAKADAAPAHTAAGRYRVPMIRVATSVLSGSSAGKITMNVAAAAPRCTV